MPAPGGWFNCEVRRTGPAEDGNTYINLTDTDGAFNSRWFRAVDWKRKEMLDTALAAITSGLQVRVSLATTDEYGVVNRLYVMRAEQ